MNYPSLAGLWFGAAAQCYVCFIGEEFGLYLDSAFEVAVLLLAAGSSQRMGDENKLLLPLKEGVMLSNALRAATQCCCASVSLLTGFDRQRILAEAESYAVQEIHNPEFLMGQDKSLAVGLATLLPAKMSVLVMLGDQPDISAELLDELITAHCSDGARRALVPVHKGQNGTPRILPFALVQRAAAAQGSLSLRQLLSSATEDVHFYPVDDAAILRDVDTPGDYRQYIKNRT